MLVTADGPRMSAAGTRATTSAAAADGRRLRNSRREPRHEKTASVVRLPGGPW